MNAQVQQAIEALIQPLTQAVADNGANAVAGRHTKKVAELDSVDPDKWRTWRHNFQNIVTINRWDDRQARLEICSSITGDAWSRVEHIPAGIPAVPAGGGPIPNAQPYTDLLDAMEQCFLPEQAGAIARVNFHSAAQREGEDLASWHGRLRSMALRAYPGWAVAINHNVQLIEHFVRNLANLEVRREVSNVGPQTYQGALEEAQKRTATLYAYQSAVKGKKLNTTAMEQHLYAITEGQADDTVAAMGNRPFTKKRKCFNCGSTQHLRRACPKPATPRQGSSQRGRGQSRGRGGGGRGGRGGSRNNNSRRDGKGYGDSRTNRLLGHIAEYLQEEPQPTATPEENHRESEQTPENC